MIAIETVCAGCSSIIRTVLPVIQQNGSVTFTCECGHRIFTLFGDSHQMAKYIETLPRVKITEGRPA